MTSTAIGRICFVIPPSAFLLDERVFMSLGILKVAAVLERQGMAIEVLDLSGVDNYLDVVRDYCAARPAGCYGLTATTPQMPAAAAIAAALRQAVPAARLILGGPHATLVHAGYRNERRKRAPGRAHRALASLRATFDVLVAGDGERAIEAALAPHPPALIDADDPTSAFFLNSSDLAEIPFPARHLVDVDSYRYSIDGTRALSLIAQLGCPFGCGFCGGRLSPFLRRVRMRGGESVVAEIEHLRERYGVRGFMLYDDELNVNPGMLDLMERIHAAQRARGEQYRLRGFIKAQLFTDAQAAAMYRAGFRWILVGFESGSERMLVNMNKKSARAENTRCVDIARRHGLKVKALMSVGHPGESSATVAETRDWLLEVRPDDFDVSVITAYPGTPYFDDARESNPGVWTYTAPRGGDRLHSVEVDFESVAEYYKGVPGEYCSYVYTDALDRRELVEERDRLEAAVRAQLGIPYPAGVAARRYEHSMGQSPIPKSILRTRAAATMRSAQAAGGPSREAGR